MRKTPCPHCNDIWIYFDDFDRFQYKMNCSCGYAWRNSQWKNSKEEAVHCWNDHIRDTTKKAFEIDLEAVHICSSIGFDCETTLNSFGNANK